MVIDVVKQWVRRCQSHPICQLNYSPSPTEDSFRPTRLIAVGSSNEETVRLIDDLDSVGDVVEWVALSHCWGKTRMRKQLLNADLNAMKSSISITDLSKTFQDAIIITRGMEVPYIWIDSLCILQDSDGPGPEDWRKEANRMGLVYAHAVCVISATASADSEQGCFYDKKSPESLPKYILRTNIDSGGQTRALVVYLDEPQDASLADLFRNHVEEAPLTTRGWTFQERVLAKRIVHFCNGFILFECNTVRASQYQPEGVHYPPKEHLHTDGSLRSPEEYAQLMERDERFIMGMKKYAHYVVNNVGIGHPTGASYESPALIENPNYRTAEQKRIAFLNSAALQGMRGEFQLILFNKAQTEHERVAFHCAWYEIVGRYSIRVLTHEQDRLIALAGIANFIERSTGRHFVAGMWEETLRLNLLWNVKSPSQSGPLPSAPLWSWASVQGGVETQIRSRFATAPYPSVKFLVSDITISDTTFLHESRVTGANLTLRYRYDITSLSTYHVLPDVEDRLVLGGNTEIVYVPIIHLAWENRQQVHGVYFQGSNDFRVKRFERMGYIWAEDNETGPVKPSRLLRKRRKRTILLV